METTTHIGGGGRIVLPAEFRRALDVQVGDEVILRLDKDEVRVSSRAAAIRRAQEIVRRHVPAARRLSDEVVAERHEEAFRE